MSQEVEYKDVVFINWRDSDACLTLHCACGEMTHVDAYFAYNVECYYCHRLYHLDTRIDTKPVTLDEIQGQAIVVTEDD